MELDLPSIRGLVWCNSSIRVVSEIFGGMCKRFYVSYPQVGAVSKDIDIGVGRLGFESQTGYI